MDEARALHADAFDLAARRVGFVLRIEEGVLERRRAAVDHEDLLRPLAFQTQPVGVLALAKRGRRLGRIGHHLLEALDDGLREVLHGAGLGQDDRLEQGDRDPQHLAPRFGDEVGQRLVAAHQRHLAKGVAGLQTPEHLALAAVRHDGSRQLALQQHAQKARFLAELDHGFVGFVRDHACTLHQIRSDDRWRAVERGPLES